MKSSPAGEGVGGRTIVRCWMGGVGMEWMRFFVGVGTGCHDVVF